MKAKEDLGVGPIVHSTQARFRKALNFPDGLLVGGRAAEVHPDRIVVEHVVWSRRLSAVAAEGQVIVVNFDYRNGVKAPFTDAMRTAILDLERSSGSEPAVRN
jgi:acyl-CoA thioester hydrolase